MTEQEAKQRLEDWMQYQRAADHLREATKILSTTAWPTHKLAAEAERVQQQANKCWSSLVEAIVGMVQEVPSG